MPPGETVELCGGPLDGERVHWLRSWTDAEWFGDVPVGVHKAQARGEPGSIRATRIAPEIVDRLACVLYQRTTASGGGLAHFRHDNRREMQP